MKASWCFEMYYINLRRADELYENINPKKGRYDRFLKVGSLILIAFGLMFLYKVSEFRNEVEQEFAKRDSRLAEIVIRMSRANEKLEKILDMASEGNPPHTMEFTITYPTQ